jgi:hypothetical protein
MNSTPQTWDLVVLLCDCRTVNEVTKAATSQKEEIWKRFHNLLITIPQDFSFVKRFTHDFLYKNDKIGLISEEYRPILPLQKPLSMLF